MPFDPRFVPGTAGAPPAQGNNAQQSMFLTQPSQGMPGSDGMTAQTMEYRMPPGQQPYPMPPPPAPQPGFSPFNPTPGPVAPATPPQAPTPPPGAGAGPSQPGGANAPRQPGIGGPPPDAPTLWNPQASNSYGGQQIAGSNPSMGEYGSVQNYADQAFANNRRYLDPQQATENRRMDQELINKGVDPNSAQGREMQDQLGRQQADANNAASFGALQFGQGVQNQMSQQELANQQLAGNMQQGLWNNKLGASGQGLQQYLGEMQNQLGQRGQNIQQYGMDQNFNLGKSGQALQQYGMDQNFNLGQSGQALQQYGMDQNFALGQSGQDLQRYQGDQANALGQGQLNMNQAGQDFNQMMGLEANQFRDNRAQNADEQWMDQLYLSMNGATPIPGVNPVNGAGMYQTGVSGAAGDQGLLGRSIGF